MEAQSRQSIAEYAEEAGTKGLVIIADRVPGGGVRAG